MSAWCVPKNKGWGMRHAPKIPTENDKHTKPAILVDVSVEDMAQKPVRDILAGGEPGEGQFPGESSALTGAQRLLHAIFQDAWTALVKKASGKREYREYLHAVAWVSGEYEDAPFSFQTACDCMGFDVDATRKRLLGLKHQSRIGTVGCINRHIVRYSRAQSSKAST